MSRFYPNSFSVSSFISEIGKSSFARPDRYEVFFSNTKSGQVLFDRANQEKMNLRLESLSLPSSSVASSPLKLQSIDREMPYGMIYEGEIKMEFIEDESMSIRTLFKKWQERVIDQRTYQLNYYNDYICNLEIKLLDITDEKEKYSITVFDVFPKTIDAVDLQTSFDSFVKTTVNLSYRKWIDNSI